MNNIHDIKKHNSGLFLEKLINQANHYYCINNKCLAYKKPTPICVLKSEGSKIINAFFEQKSTTDYYGLYDGVYFDFDAKSVSTNQFNVKKIIKPHQLKYLQAVKKHGGIGFIIVDFYQANQFYLLDIDYLLAHKTIYQDKIPSHLKIQLANNCILDYLKTLKEVYALR